MKKFSKSWKSSKKPKKQRKYRYNAPQNIRHKMMSAPLSKDLRKKYGKRNIPIRKGDRVKIKTGQFKKIIGKIERVNLKKLKVYIEGAQLTKRDGTKALYPIDPSNIMVMELNLDDKRRKKVLERK